MSNNNVLKTETNIEFEPQSKKYQDKLTTIVDQFTSVLDDYKKYYVFTNKNPEVDEYQNFYLENKNQLQNLNKDVFLMSSDIEKSIQDLNYLVTRLNAKLSGEKELTGELAKLMQNLKQTNNGADTMLYDTTFLYNKKYMQNVELLFGIVTILGLLFTLFKKKHT